ncbi:uracil-DNA glycosylase family protein [Flavobacterium rakeshii]|uniref:Uracil-DNA glycosylase family protein n=1 Tax=Flavobacterium rakeshii TaxID=1038845 RepID=A0A6N8HI01_9FLAO|nr:uracil-DNA glycosylase family protein [Flavobacterium rakeshii]MUV05394.1 uracil-DNA glycosylase family protein [Flavobacterium rakeshii]
MNELLSQIQHCIQCKEQLPFTPKPVVQAHTDSKIIIIGQAPGLKVQNSGIPWDDQSGNELRRWLNVTKEQFYNPELFALIPMGFCYPGKGKSGDLPPRSECAPLWHKKLLEAITNPQLILLIGQYAQKYYLGNKLKPTLTDTVKAYSEFLPHYLPLVHPSPRNKIWQKKNPWFEQKIVPQLQVITKKVIHS